MGNRLSAGLKVGYFRSFGATIILIAYLVSGALHGACGLVLHETTLSASCQTSDPSENPDSVLPSHHCHGCFSVVISVLETSAIAAPVGYELKWGAILIDGLTPTLNTPPPKALA